MLKEVAEGIVIPIKVIPKSHRNEVLGWEQEELKVRITAAPEKGAANETLIRFLAKFFSIASSRITLLYGSSSRHKRLLIKGATLQEITKALESLSSQNSECG